MRRQKHFLPILLFWFFFCLNPALGFGGEATVEFEGRAWFPELEAKAKVPASGLGTSFNIPSDLGVDDEVFPEGRLIWHTGPHSQLRLTYTQATYEGDQAVTRTIEFKGQTYTAGTRVQSEFELRYFSVGWIWQFLHFWEDRVRLGPVIEGKGISADVSLDAPNTSPPIRESEEVLGVAPTAGLALGLTPIKRVEVFAEGSGLALGDLGHFFDVETGLRFIPFKNLTISGGYRFLDFKVKVDPDFLDVELAGFFAGGSVRF